MTLNLWACIRYVAGNGQQKRREQKNFIPTYEITTVFDLDLQSTLASHLASTVIMSFLCQPV